MINQIDNHVARTSHLKLKLEDAALSTKEINSIYYTLIIKCTAIKITIPYHLIIMNNEFN